MIIKRSYYTKSSALTSVAFAAILLSAIIIATGLAIGLNRGYGGLQTTTVTQTSTMTDGSVTTVTDSSGVTTVTSYEFTPVVSDETTTVYQNQGGTTTSTITSTLPVTTTQTDTYTSLSTVTSTSTEPVTSTTTTTVTGPTTTTTQTNTTTSSVTVTSTSFEPTTTTTTVSGPTTTTTQEVTTTETVTATPTSGNVVPFSIDSLVLNSETNSWTLNMTNYSNFSWTIDATLNATSGEQGSATTSSNMNIYPFAPGAASDTVSGVGPTPLQAGQDYCVYIVGTPVGSTVFNGNWTWESCFIEAV